MARTSPSNRPDRRHAASAISIAVLLVAAGTAIAGPRVERIVRGTVSVHEQGGHTRIEASDRSIINFRSFDIGASESVRFVQPGSSARVLGRVTGNTPSAIEGSLSANGRLYLVNPAGVIFGRGAVVNAAGFYAAAAHMTDADFLGRVDRFTGARGSIINRGAITAGAVSLVGASVLNTGTIVGSTGAVVMASGSEVIIQPRGSRVMVRVDASSAVPAHAAVAAIENTGRITARTGVSMMSGDLYSIAVRNSGSVKAPVIEVAGGTGLVEVSGVLDASARAPGGRGGDIAVTGDRVGITGAILDASGDAGGGRVRVGGDRQGTGPLANARVLYVGADSAIHADALSRGDGGTAILYASDTARIHGEVTARAGRGGGDGGFIETSGRRHLEVGGVPDARAVGGRPGTWLIDPTDLTLTDGGNGAATTPGVFNPPDPYEVGSGVSTLDIDNVRVALEAGSNVTLLTGVIGEPGDVGADAGNIALNSPLLVAADIPAGVQPTLTIRANNNITFGNGAFIDLSAAGETLTVDLQAVNGSITLNNNYGAGASGGALRASGAGTTLNAIFTAGLNVTLGNSGGGAAISAAGGTVNASIVTGGGATGLVTVATDLALGSDGTFVSSSGQFNQTGGVIAVDAADGGSGVAARITTTGTATLGSITNTSGTSGGILAVAGDDLTVTGDLASTTGTISLQAGSAVQATLAVDAGVTISAPSIALRAGSDAAGGASDVDLSAADASTFRGAGGAGSPEVFSLRQEAALSDAPVAALFQGGVAGLDYSLRADEGTLTIATAARVADSDLTLRSATGVAITAALDLQSLSVVGPVTVSAAGTTVTPTVRTGGDQSYDGIVTIGADTVLTSDGGGDITFGQSFRSDADGRTLEINTSGLTWLKAGSSALVGERLSEITTDGPAAVAIEIGGTTRIGDGSGPVAITTLDLQTYRDAVVLDADTTLTVVNPGQIDFANTVDSFSAGTPRSLVVETSTALFNSSVGAVAPLSSLRATGATTVGLGTPGGSRSVITTGAQTYEGVLTLANNVTLTSTASGTISFDAVVRPDAEANARELTINTAGITWLKAGTSAGGTLLRSLVTDATAAAANERGGSTRLGDGAPVAVRTVATQTYNDAVVLAADTTFETSGALADVLFVQTIDALNATARALITAVGAGGRTRFGGLVGRTNSLLSVDVSGPITLAVAGTTADPSITTTGSQDFGGDVTLGADTTLTSTASGAITFDALVNADAAANGRDLTVNTAGLTWFKGGAGNAQSLASLTTDDIAAPGGQRGGSTRLGDVAATGVMTSGAQLYGDAVALSQDTVLTAGGPVTFSSTLDSLTATARAIQVAAVGTTTFAGVVGNTNALLTVEVTGPASISAAGTTLAPSVRTTGAQTYAGPVTLAADVVLTSTAAGGITLSGAVDADIASNDRDLTVNTGGVTTISGDVGASQRLATITTDAPGGATRLGNPSASTAVRTLGGQTYGESVQLRGDVTISSLNGGDVTFSSTVIADAADRDLTVNTAGQTWFKGDVGSGQALATVTTDAAGAPSGERGGSVRLGDAAPAIVLTTSGAQTFNDAVLLSADTTMTSAAGDIAFNSTVDSLGAGRSLLVNTPGVTRFGDGDADLVGGVLALSSLTTDAPGSARFEIVGGPASVRTTGAQTYADAVTLASDTRLQASSSGAVLFRSTVDSSSASARALAVATSGTVTFGDGGPDFVGSIFPLSSLTIEGPGSVRFHTSGPGTGTVRTTGGQTYAAMVLGSDTLLVSTAGGQIWFTSTVDSDPGSLFTLETSSSGSTRFQGRVGATDALRALRVAGPARIDAAGTGVAPSIRTSETQEFVGPVTLFADTVLASSLNRAITLGAVDADDAANGRDLSVNTGGVTTFRGDVGATQRLATLTTDFAGTIGEKTVLGGPSAVAIRTTGAQTYDDAVELGASAAIFSNAGGDIVFEQTVDAASPAFGLDVSTSALAWFKGDVGAVGPLASLATDSSTDPLERGGATRLGAGGAIAVRTTGVQTYNDVIALAADATLTSLTAGDVTFSELVGTDADGRALTVNTAGVTWLKPGTTSVAGTRLGSISTDAPGSTRFGAGGASDTSNVTTVGDQTYLDAVRLAGAVILTSASDGGVTLGSTVDADSAANPRTLEVRTGGDTSFLGDVGVAERLAGLITDADGAVGERTLLGSGPGTIEVRTGASGQSYADAVVIVSDAVLSAGSGGGVTFGSTVDSGDFGARSLTVNASGQTWFRGNVGATTALNALTTDAPSAALSDLGGTTRIGDAAPVTVTTVTTVATQTYNDAVRLDAATTLIALGDVTFASTVDSFNGTFRSLVVNTPGVTRFGDGGADLVGAASALSSLTTDAPGSTSINIVAAAPQASIITDGSQTFADAVTLEADSILVSFSGGDIAFLSTLDSGTAAARSLTVNTAGSTRFGDGGADFVGAAAALSSIVTDAPGLTRIWAVPNASAPFATVRTTGAQSYGDALVLAADTRLAATSAGDISFASTIDSLDATPRALVVDTAGVTRFGDGGQDYVGSTFALASLATDAAGSTILNISRPAPGSPSTVRTTGGQTYADAVEIAADTLLTSSASGDVTLASTIDSGAAGPRALIIDTAGRTTIRDAGASRRLSTLTTDAATAPANERGGITEIGTVRTTGGQAYNDAVEVVAGALASSSATGDIAFASTVDSVAAGDGTLRVDTAGSTTFSRDVGSTRRLASIVTDAEVSTTAERGGVTILGSGADGAAIRVETSGDQTFNDALRLRADATLSAAGDVTFASTVDADSAASNRDLVVNASGVTAFRRDVGATQRLASLTTDAPSAALGDRGGRTDLGDGSSPFALSATGDVRFGDAVLLRSAATLSSAAAGEVAFATTVDSASPAARSLIVNTAGVTRFAGDVGSTNALASLATDRSGTAAERTVLGGQGASVRVRTVGAQSYADAADLAADAVLVSDDGGTIRFERAINADASANGRDLIVNTSGLTWFEAGAGATAALGSLVIDAADATASQRGGEFRLGNDGGASISLITTGFQQHNNAVLLSGDTTVVSTAAGDVNFASTVDSLDATPRSLTVNTSGATRFGDGGADAVGGRQALASLTTDAGGVTAFNVNRSVAGSPATVRTTGAQTFGDDLVIAVATASRSVLFRSTGGAPITFAGRLFVDGGVGADLAVDTAGDSRFAADIGTASARFRSFTTDAPGTTVLGVADGPALSVFTSADQTYRDGLRLAGDTTLDAGAGRLLLLGGVASDSVTPRDLTLTTAAPSFFEFGDASETLALRTPIVVGRGLGTTDRPLGVLTLTDRDVPSSRTSLEFATLVLGPVANVGEGFVRLAAGQEGADLDIIASRFVMGLGHRMTAFGDLTIGGPGGSRADDVVLGDVNTLGDFTIRAQRLILRTPRLVNVANRDGLPVEDKEVSIAYGGLLDADEVGVVGSLLPGEDFTQFGDVLRIGDRQNVFGGNTPFGSPVLLQDFAFREFKPVLDRSTFLTTSDDPADADILLPLSLPADGPVGLKPNPAGSLPREDQSARVDSRRTLDAATVDELLQLKVLAVPPGTDELVSFLVGRRLFNDAGRYELRPASNVRVSQSRFDQQAVSDALAVLRELNRSRTRTTDGVTEELRGFEFITLAFADAQTGFDEKYPTLPLESITAAQFEAYIRAEPAHADAAAALDELRTLSARLESVGFTSYELARIRESLREIYLAKLDERIARELLLPVNAASDPQPEAAPAPAGE